MSKGQVKISSSIAGIGGKSFLHDVYGKSYRVSELPSVLEKDSLQVIGFDQETWQAKTVRIQSCVEGKSSKLLKIQSRGSFLELQQDCMVYVNENGDLNKAPVGELIAGDLLLIPKLLSFRENNFQIENVFPKKRKGSLIKQRVGGKLHEADASMSITFLMGLAFAAGLIDCKGTYNLETGDILFSTNDKVVNNIFAHLISSSFLVEPEINGSLVRVQNKVVAMLIDSFLKEVASQNEEIIANYLAGYFHASNAFGFFDKAKLKPCIYLHRGDEVSSDRLCKCLLTIGVVPLMSNSSYIIVDSGHIETFFSSIPYLMKSLIMKVDDYMTDLTSRLIPATNFLGYKFGKSFSNIKKDAGMAAEKYEKLALFEQDNVVMNHDMAAELNKYIKKKSKQSSLSKLVESSVVGIKVYSIENASVEKTFTITCDDSCGIFLNNILCAC